MNWEPITSRENKLLRHISRLISDTKYRRANGEYVCEGEKLLREALRDGVVVRAVLWEQQSLREAQLRDPELFAMLVYRIAVMLRHLPMCSARQCP